MRKCLGLLLCLMAVQSLSAADLQVFVNSRESYVGQSLQLTMRISSSKVIGRPDPGVLPGFKITPGAESRYEQRSLGSGRSSRTVTMEYSWHLQPLETGTHVIPSFEMELDGELYRSPEIEILIREPGRLEGYHLILSSQGETVFPGVPVRVSLKWLFSSEVSRPEFMLPFLNQENIDVADLPPPSSQSSDIYQFKVEGRTLYAVQSAEIYDGEQYASLTVSWDIYPREEGTVILEPVTIGFQRSLMNRQGIKSYAPGVILSNSLRLEVKELPPELRDFKGGIMVARNKLTVDLSLDQTRIYPGDPLELSLSIKGLSSPDLSHFKGISFLDELRGILRVDRGSLMSEIRGTEKIYTQKIRIKTAELDSFPSITIPYFNLEKGTVEQAVTAPVPLTLLSLDDPNPFSEEREIESPDGENGESEGSLSLRGNHRIRKSPLLDLLHNQGLKVSLLFLLMTLLLLVSPHMKKGVSLLRFGRKGSGLRNLLRTALRDFSKMQNLKNGQRLYEILLRWGNEVPMKDEDKRALDDLIIMVERKLWAAGGGIAEEECEKIIMGVRTILKSSGRSGGVGK